MRRLVSVLLFCLAFLRPSTLSAPSALEPLVPFGAATPSLDEWTPLAFPRIERRSTFDIESRDGALALRMASDNGASGIVWGTTFNPYAYRKLTFTWMVDAVLAVTDPLSKKGDDYAARVFVLFPYDPNAPGSAPRLLYSISKTLYGVYPPYAALNFVWGNTQTGPARYRNPFTDRSGMIPLDAGTAFVGRWRTHTVDIIEEYRAMFAEDPPDEATLAVMTDSDNTGTSTSAWIRSIVLESTSNE